MKNLVAALVIVLLAASTASAGWTYVSPVVVPAPVVYNYWPVGPVYAYPAPVTHIVARPVMAAPMVMPPVMAPAPVLFAPAPVVYARPIVVRSKVFIPGRPIRNVIRAVLP